MSSRDASHCVVKVSHRGILKLLKSRGGGGGGKVTSQVLRIARQELLVAQDRLRRARSRRDAAGELILKKKVELRKEEALARRRLGLRGLGN